MVDMTGRLISVAACLASARRSSKSVLSDLFQSVTTLDEINKSVEVKVVVSVAPGRGRLCDPI
jgi:hypothetical protein